MNYIKELWELVNIQNKKKVLLRSSFCTFIFTVFILLLNKVEQAVYIFLGYTASISTPTIFFSLITMFIIYAFSDKDSFVQLSTQHKNTIKSIETRVVFVSIFGCLMFLVSFVMEFLVTVFNSAIFFILIAVFLVFLLSFFVFWILDFIRCFVDILKIL